MMATATEVMHTPGPWEIFYIHSPDGTSYRIFSRAGEKSQDIAHLPRGFDNALSNSLLIAAAPDLLRQCRMMEVIIRGLLDDPEIDNNAGFLRGVELGRVADNARNAIDAANGSLA